MHRFALRLIALPAPGPILVLGHGPTRQKYSEENRLSVKLPNPVRYYFEFKPLSGVGKIFIQPQAA